MHIALMTGAVFSILMSSRGAFAQIEASSSDHASSETCYQVGAIQLSAAKIKARLRSMPPVSSPLLYSSMRMTTAVLTFWVGTDEDGKVICIRAISGHPIMIAGAFESVKASTFRPLKVRGQRQPTFGPLILAVSMTKHGIRTRVLKAELHRPSWLRVSNVLGRK